MAPGLVGPGEGRARQAADRHLVAHDRADRRREKTGYPDAEAARHPPPHRPASSRPEDGIVLDFFAGSGTAGAAAFELGRRFLMVDDNPAACAIMRDRFAVFDGVAYAGFDTIDLPEPAGA